MAHKIVIRYETRAEAWKSDASMYALAIALFIPGLMAGSSAMQWLAAVIFFVCVAGLASNREKKMTIGEARAYLDKIEALNPPSVEDDK